MRGFEGRAREVKVLSGFHCHTVKVVERDNHIKVHSKDLFQLVHQGRVIHGENSNVVS